LRPQAISHGQAQKQISFGKRSGLPLLKRSARAPVALTFGVGRGPLASQSWTGGAHLAGRDALASRSCTGGAHVWRWPWSARESVVHRWRSCSLLGMFRLPFGRALVALTFAAGRGPLASRSCVDGTHVWWKRVLLASVIPAVMRLAHASAFSNQLPPC
jgi:hypothetical protein